MRLGLPRYRWERTASRLEVPLVRPLALCRDIATHLGVTKDTVYAWIAEKGMPAHKMGRLWKSQVSEVDEWVRSGSAASSGEGATRDGV